MLAHLLRLLPRAAATLDGASTFIACLEPFEVRTVPARGRVLKLDWAFRGMSFDGAGGKGKRIRDGKTSCGVGQGWAFSCHERENM